MPKLKGSTYSPLLGYQFIDKIMNPSDDKLDVLSSEFIEYLHMLRKYDDYKYVNDNNLKIDMDTWEKICRVRRITIESDFRLATYEKDVADKHILLKHLNNDKKEKETMINELQTNIEILESQDSHSQGDLLVKQFGF